MAHPRNRIPIISLVLLASGLASCGGGGSSSTPAPPSGSAAMVTPYDDKPWTPYRSEFEAMATALENSDNEFLGKHRLDEAERELQLPDLSPIEFASVRAKFTQDRLNLGNVDEAFQFAQEIFDTYDPVPHPSCYTLRGLVYLRQAEVYNCIDRHNAECCIFPLQGGGLHELADPARLARDDFRTYLDILYGEGDEVSFTDLETVWLLNLVNMATNEYPEGVPERYRIPEAAWESEYDIGHFPDVAGELGIDTFSLCGGSIVEDFNGDGLLDIISSTFDPLGVLSHYVNNGDGTFTDATETSHSGDQLGGLNCLAGDYDNDGDMDVVVLRGAWLMDNGQLRNSLVRNNGDGTFTDVSFEAGVARPARPGQSAAWLDYDNDGDLDLYVASESRRELDVRGDFPNVLFRNDGDGTFTNVTREAGVTNDRYAKGVTVGDYDNDGDTDIYVSNVGRNRLYRNNGDDTFTDVAERLGLQEPSRESFATWFWDYNNDGWLDIWVCGFNALVSDVCADYLGLPYTAANPALYRNNGDGTFTDVAGESNLHHPYLPMGAGFGDLDNDGFQDIYLATGQPGYQILMPNIMLRNDAGERFQDVTFSGGFGHLQKGHGVSFADIDNDGDQDIYNQIGGMLWGDRYHNALFLNPGHGNRFVVIKLEGVTTNRMAVGARIKVLVQTDDGEREFHRSVGSASSFGGNPIRQEIGLGQATGIIAVEIDWPASGTSQRFTNVSLDTMIRVAEGEEDFEVLPFEPIALDIKGNEAD